MWSSFAATKACWFPISIACPSSCLGKQPWKTRLKSFRCLASEHRNWIALFYQVTAIWWVTLSLFRNISSEWNGHSSRQLSVFLNCLCPCVDCEDITFPTLLVWRTHRMTQLLVPTLRPPSTNHPLWNLRGWRSFEANWTPYFHTRKLRSRDVSGLPPAPLGQQQIQATCSAPWAHCADPAPPPSTVTHPARRVLRAETLSHTRLWSLCHAEQPLVVDAQWILPARYYSCCWKAAWKTVLPCCLWWNLINLARSIGHLIIFLKWQQLMLTCQC